MRVLGAGVAALCFVGSLTAQAPSSTPASGSTAVPVGTLNEIMRGIYFRNANLIFDVQVNDPAASKVATGEAASTVPFAGVYTKWEDIEYAAIALTDAVDLLLTPGRLCQNGKPVPVTQADYRKAADNMRTVAQATLATVRTKNREKVADATGDLAEACQGCHQVFRRGDGDRPTRCTAPAR